MIVIVAVGVAPPETCAELAHATTTTLRTNQLMAEQLARIVKRLAAQSAKAER